MLELVKEILFFLFFPQPEYTLLNTLIYSIKFVFASYLFFIFLKRIRIKIDKKLAISLSSFVLFGSSLRVLGDVGVVKSFFLVTPLIYLIVGLLLSFLLMLSLTVQKKIKVPYFKTTFFIGVLLSIINLSFLVIRIVKFDTAFFVLVFLLPWLILLKIIKWKKENKVVLLAQVFDATVTFVGINFFDYREMHVLPKFLINMFGPVSFIFLKALVTFSILFLLDRCVEDREIKNYIKLVIGVLGASTGTRDFLRILLLV